MLYYNFLTFLYRLKKNFNSQKKLEKFKKLEYYSYLEKLHKILKPKNYIEVGIRNGVSLALANRKTKCIGIDPNPFIKVNLSKNTEVYPMTSDDFFEKYKGDNKLQNIDFAFIDGMHLFEFVLRDFINIEKYCHSGSFIALHDTVPKDEVTAQRDRTTDFWTGDVYKMILILQKYRPELKIYNSDAQPSGLALVTNLNPNSTVLEDNYDKILEEFMDYDFNNVMQNKNSILDIKPVKNLVNFINA